jgi:hypothetical protein
MAEPRRVRDESLVLRREGLPDRELAKGNVAYWSDPMPSQRRFQVSPDARVLAYVAPHGGELHVLRRDGAELVLDGAGGHDLRFSPDGSTLAVSRQVSSGVSIDRVELRRMAQSPWAELRSVAWMEHCADGLVASHWDKFRGNALTLVPWKGQLRTLVETMGTVSRFSAASAGSRVVYLVGSGAWSLDGPGADPSQLPVEGYAVSNMEMSPDGRSLAVVTTRGIDLYEGDAAPSSLGTARDIHTVWFSRDGAELAWASPDLATWRRGDSTRRLAATEWEGKIAAMRFLHAGAGLLVSRGNEVLRWSPESDQAEVLTRVEDGRELLGADVFAGGLVLWLGTPLSHTARGT